jgi:arabinose-5-phosphate isomerase
MIAAFTGSRPCKNYHHRVQHSSINYWGLDVTKETGNCHQSVVQANGRQTQVIVAEIITQEATAVSRIPMDNPYDAVTELIYDHCQKRKGKIVIFGVGKAGEIGKKLAVTFCSTGTPAVFMHPLEGLHGDLGLLQENDLLLAISNSGKTREILEIVPLARRLISDIPLICLTGTFPSPLADIANYVLCTGSVLEVCPLGLTPTTSTTVMNVIGDIIVCLQMARIDFQKEHYALRHHGGYLGSITRTQIQEAARTDSTDRTATTDGGSTCATPASVPTAQSLK